MPAKPQLRGAGPRRSGSPIRPVNPAVRISATAVGRPVSGRSVSGRSGRSVVPTLILLVAALLLILNFRMFMFFLVGMSPTVVAFIIDADPRKYAARSVGFLNFAGLTPYFGRLLDERLGQNVVIDLASDMTAWLVVGGAAGAGWLLYFSMPMLVGQVMRLADTARIGSLRARQRDLAKEWGEDIRSGTAGGKGNPPGR